MDITCFTVGPFAENTYLLAEKGQALIIDPGFSSQNEFNELRSVLEEQDLTLLAVLLTHAHVDHVMGLPYVLSHFEVPVYLSDKDRYLWDNFSSQAAMFGFQVKGFDFNPRSLPITEDWAIGPFEFDVRYTPGHAPDHLSLYHAKSGSLIAGDALFKEGVGRTDLYKGDMNLLKESIREQLYVLPDETRVYSGHGPETTIGHEKESNPFVKLEA
ncbi:MBL fold metallo-hydrolase [Fodinibius sediminis]|nr:MBL fold metallo-hydrolase [Fodinibius sediminis]